MTSPNASERLRTASAFQESCVLIAMAELDLATQILERSNNATAADLAESAHLDLRALTILLDALAGLEFFTKSADARYSVAEPYRELLDSRHPTTFIPMLRHQGNCLRSWSQLAWVVTGGVPAQKHGSILGPEADGVSFILAMNSVGRLFASATVEDLKKSDVFIQFRQRKYQVHRHRRCVGNLHASIFGNAFTSGRNDF